MLSGFLSWLWCYRLGSPAWGLDSTLLRVIPLTTEISLWNLSYHPWEPSQPSHTSSALPTSHVVVKWFLLFFLGYEASLQLVFSCLFKVISLQFSCNSRLVLGGGLCSFHWLPSHLGSPCHFFLTGVALASKGHLECFGSTFWLSQWNSNARTVLCYRELSHILYGS